ncbi:MAG: hypothetical protein DDT19_01041 [Syntrophomonadaceae bacterium]|nr:hypothetical protein [Bacillota bacterium]
MSKGYNETVVKSAKRLVKELDVTEKHNIGIINSGLRTILHKYCEGKMSLMLALDKIHEVFKKSEINPNGKIGT